MKNARPSSHDTLSVAPVQLQEVKGTDNAHLSVHIDAQIFSATRVRRKVNGWLAMAVGDRLLAGEPELIISAPLYWRVPLDWTSPTLGLLAARIAEVLVDATLTKMHCLLLGQKWTWRMLLLPCRSNVTNHMPPLPHTHPLLVGIAVYQCVQTAPQPC